MRQSQVCKHGCDREGRCPRLRLGALIGSALLICGWTCLLLMVGLFAAGLFSFLIDSQMLRSLALNAAGVCTGLLCLIFTLGMAHLVLIVPGSGTGNDEYTDLNGEQYE